MEVLTRLAVGNRFENGISISITVDCGATYGDWVKAL